MSRNVEGARGRRAIQWAWGIPTWGWLLLTPVLAVLVLRVRPMFVFDVIDPIIYTGYSQNGADLMTRFGPDVYNWVRFGAILPERLAFLAFGPLPGFYVLRYLLLLLATVPLFMLLDRRMSRAVAYLGVAVLLTSPVLYGTLGSDYPDAFIMAYLSAAYALVLLPVSSRRSWRAAAAVGVLLAGCLHGQVVSLPVVASLLLGYLAVQLRSRAVGATLRTAALALAGAVLITGVFVAIAQLWLGHADIFTPTITNYQLLQRPEELVNWHSTNTSWATRIPYLAVPVVVAVGWLAALVGTRGHRLGDPELAAGVWLLASTAAAFALQFWGTVATLEYRLYSSSLWVPTLLVVTFLLLRLAGPSSPVIRLIIAVVTVAFVASFVHPSPLAHPYRYLAGLSAMLLVVCAIALVVRRPRIRLGLVVVVVMGLMALTAAPHKKPQGLGFSPLPAARYDQIFGYAGEQLDLLAYRASVEMPALVGPAPASGAVPYFWMSRSADPTVSNAMAAMYLWRQLPKGLPESAAAADTARSIVSAAPRPLVIVAEQDFEAEAMLAVLTDNDVAATVRTRAYVPSVDGDFRLWVVDLPAF